MSGDPLVSVGIPTYNNIDGLKNVLDCITGQTYKNLEIIVSINATPNHETNLTCILICQEAKEKDARITWFFQLSNIGADENFRFVRKKSTGKYVMSAQDDDWWDTTYIENLVKALEAHPELPLAACPSYYRTPEYTLSPIRTLKNLSVYNAVGNGDLGLATQGIWKRECMIELEYPPDRVIGIEHVLATIILLKYGKILVVDSERYIKGYTAGKFGECFKYQPLYPFRSWWYMIKTIAQSDQITSQRKLLLPVMAITNFVRACGITGVQMIVAMPNNPIKRAVQRRFFGAN